MSIRSYEIHGFRIVELTADAAPLRSERDAVETIGLAAPHRAQIIVIPTERLEDGFFQLKTRIAGEIIQKFVTYGLHVVVMGDVSTYTQSSSAFRDFVYECNRGSYVWFVAGIEELESRLRSQANTQ